MDYTLTSQSSAMTLYVMCILPCVVVMYIYVTLEYVRKCVWSVE